MSLPKQHFVGILIFAILCLVGSQANGQQPPQNLVSRFNFAIRTLEDGSKTFDTLIRSQTGLLIYGCVRKPTGQGPFPGVILVHGGLGGNLGGTRNSALNSTPANLLVRHGYAILSTDYRALDWINAYQDVESAVKFFKQLPGINGDAIAVMGGSHGGKLALELVTHIDLQAAIPCSGLYDLAKLYQHCITSEFHQRELPGNRLRPSQAFMRDVTAQMGGTPEEVPEAYLKHSAINRISHVQTPLLIVHGEQDASVPVEWSKELVAKLEELDKSVESFYAEKGPHGFYWGSSSQGNYGVPYDPSENEAFLGRMLAFLDKHLKQNTQ